MITKEEFLKRMKQVGVAVESRPEITSKELKP